MGGLAQRGMLATVSVVVVAAGCHERAEHRDAGAPADSGREAGAEGGLDGGTSDAAFDGGDDGMDAGSDVDGGEGSDSGAHDGGASSGDSGVDAAGSEDAASPELDGGGPEPDGGTDADACPAGDCDLLSGGGCGATDACYFVSSGGGDPAPVCLPVGSGFDGVACTADDDCAEGYGCEPDESVCRHYCCMGSDVGCPVGQTCRSPILTAGGAATGAGFCRSPPPCDPILQTGCPTGLGCYPDHSAETLCVASVADLGEGEACTALNDCAPGLICAAGATTVCHRLCDTTDGSRCAMDQTCTYAGFSAHPDLGVCTPAASP